MKVIKITQETVFDILWELDKRTSLKWHKSGRKPAHRAPYNLNKDANVLAFSEAGILYYYRHIDDSMEECNSKEFVAAAVKQFGNRRSG